jgi:hypothetical protein
VNAKMERIRERQVKYRGRSEVKGEWESGAKKFGPIIIYFYGNGFLVKDMTKRAITDSYIRNRNRCIEFYIEGKRTRRADSSAIMDTNY